MTAPGPEVGAPTAAAVGVPEVAVQEAVAVDGADEATVTAVGAAIGSAGARSGPRF